MIATEAGCWGVSLDLKFHPAPIGGDPRAQLHPNRTTNDLTSSVKPLHRLPPRSPQ
jgi:hypothetical protein